MQPTQLIVPFLEIAIIALMINYLLSFFWNTRAMDLVLGMAAFLAIFAGANFLGFPVLQTLMLYVVNVAVLAILIIFQPELRLALSKLSVKGRKYREITEFDHFLDGIANTVFRLAERRMGALILLENQDALDQYAGSAVKMNAEFSPELLESLFTTTTPLHDGAVVIRGTQIIAAGCILPLAEETTQVTRAMGTRHRAGLGITQQADCLSIVVSEETGKVSVARDGIMTRGIKIDRFKGIIRSVFTPPPKRRRFSLKDWWRS